MSSKAATRLTTLLLTLAVFLLLAFPGRALGATTIGSPLAAAEAAAPCASDACTVWHSALPGARITAPTDGVLVRWSFRNAAGNGLRLRALRNISGTTYRDVGRSDPVALAAPSPDVSTFNTRIPVRAGDYVGLDVPGADTTPAGKIGAVRTVGATLLGFVPRLADGGEGPYTSGPITNSELLFNADLEPDSDKDGFGDESQDHCPSNPAIQGACRLPPPPVDRVGPLLSYARGSSVRFGPDGRFSVFVTPNELSDLRGAASVQVPRLRGRARAARLYRVRPVRKLNVPAGARARLEFKLSATARNAVKKALRRGRKVTMSVKVTATDRAGNRRTARRKFRLRYRSAARRG